MNVREYRAIRALVLQNAEYRADYEWSQSLTLCDNFEKFFTEYCFVVCNSGMLAQTAVKIFKRVIEAKSLRKSASTVFKHKHKTRSIDYTYTHRASLFSQFIAATDKIAFCETLMHIGAVTKYHLAKNLGVDCAKPDRWLVRLAQKYKTDAHRLCAELSKQTDDRISTVDYVLWRALSSKLIKL